MEPQTVKYILSKDNLFTNLMRDDARLTPSRSASYALTDEQQQAIRLLTQYATTQLLDHQRSGLMWMLQLGNRTGHGGLVLDDAGMGKSLMLCWYALVQQLALALCAKTRKKGLPALIVVPPNLANTWLGQFRQHFDLERLQQEQRLELQLSTSEHKTEVALDQPAPYIVVMSDTRLSALTRDREAKLRCDTMLIDEAHHMQSLDSQRFGGCKKVASRLTFCVTATPVVNSLLELFPLLFLARIAPFDKLRAGLQQFYELLPNSYHDKKERTEQMKRQYHHKSKGPDDNNTVKKRRRLTRAEEKERVLRLVDDYVVPNAVRRSKVSLTLPPIEERAAVVVPSEVERTVYDLCHSIFKQQTTFIYNTRWQHAVLEWIHMLRRLATHFVLELPKLREWALTTLQIPPVELDRAQRALMAAATRIKTELLDKLDKWGLTEEQLKLYLPCKMAFVVNELGPCRCKALVVSQWVDVAKAAAELLQTKWPQRAVFFVDGTVPPAQRQQRLDAFAASQDEAAILICTLRSVNEGFTITCANRLYLVDSWWNNTLEYQLFNRIYRVGQDRAVDVCQLYMQDTIETKIRLRKQSKFGESLTTLGFADDIICGDDDEGRQVRDYISLF